VFEDARLHWASAELGGIQDRRVLELGPLEGGHTYMLHQMGASSILAIEANSRAFLKCLIIKNIFHLDRADFQCGNFVSYLRESQDGFDIAIAAGVLYHMVNPAELIELLSRSTDRLYIWTHYYDEGIIGSNRRLAERMVEHVRAEHAGFVHTLHRHQYLDSLTMAFTGGTGPYSSWMEREEILDCLRHFGFRNVRTNFEERNHPNGPCLAIVAQR
jgi:hypothetical protein